MEELSPDVISTLLEPASHAALAGGIMAVLLVIGRRIINGKLKPVWERFMEKSVAVLGAMASGLIAVQQDTLDDVLRPVLTALLVVGLSVGLYRYIGDLIFGKAKDDDPPDLDGDVEEYDEDLEDTSPETPIPHSARAGDE